MKKASSTHEKCKRLLFLGDSLIEYFDWSERFPEYEVYNLGMAGETVSGLAARLGHIIRTVKNPDRVFIMSGINSLAMGEGGIADTYRDIVHTLHQAFPAAVIYIESLLPVSFPFIDNADIRQMNGRLRHIAQEEGVHYLDLHTLFTDQNKRPIERYLLDDGVHVSDEGYGVWAGEIARLLSS
ncbi:MAG: GDSL family lipase [Nitrospirae bacterium]|nr:GDSL family lipase [Nitrospirota bacterium]